VVNATAHIVAAAGLPFVVTEFNSGLGNNLLDEPYSAAFVLHQLVAMQGVPALDTLSYWTMSDIFSEQGEVSAPWQEGFGIQTIYGVPKPAYWAFTWMHELPAAAAPVAASGSAPVLYRPGSATVGTVDAIVATTTAADAIYVTALLTNFNTSGNPCGPAAVTLSFANVSTATVPAATLEVVDDAHGFAKPTWVAHGSPVYPNATEIAAEMAAAAVLQQPLALTRSGPNALQASVAMQPNSIARVLFSYTPS
jgi:xylan 1,4-beta-xylosidase